MYVCIYRHMMCVCVQGLGLMIAHSIWKSGVLADSSQCPFGRQKQVVFRGRTPHQGQPQQRSAQPVPSVHQCTSVYIHNDSE